MKEIKLSSIVFMLVTLLLVASFVLFFFNPGFVVKMIGIYSLYYVVPIALFLLLIDFSLNKQLEKKDLLRGVISVVILLLISLILRYWVSTSFHIFP